MKLKTVIAFLLVVFCANAQMKDLATLATGKVTYFSAVMDQEQNNLYGYLALYEQGEVEKGKLKMQYLILDKNLNKVQNGNYTQIIKVPGYCNFKNTAVVKVKTSFLLFSHRDQGSVPAENVVEFNSLNLNSFREISLKENKATEEKYYNGEEFSQLNHLDKDFPSNFKKGFSRFESGTIITETFSGYSVTKFDKECKKFDTEAFCLYNTSHKKLWEYRYNEGASKKQYRRLTYIKGLGNTLLFKVIVFQKDAITEERLLALDIVTGKVNFDYLIADKKLKIGHIYDYAIRNDKFYITGNYYKSQGATLYNQYDQNKHFGVFRIVLNMNGDEVDKKYFPWQEAASFINIKDDGKVDDDNYQLASKDNFIFEDGSISFLYEKYKSDNSYLSKYKTKELVLMNFDENFKMKGVESVHKDKSKGFDQGDYLFAQYLNKKKGVVFFFEDKREEEKKWALGINKFIDGKYGFEEIPISSKKEEFAIVPYYAKDGYILLREFNEKDDKYNQIRLEKLNL